MRILLTGTSGQVGGALRISLGAIGTVVALDRDQLDLSLPDTIPLVLSEAAPDLIINPAAYTAVDRAEDDVEIAYRVNSEGPGHIAAWAGARGVPLIHFSTDYIFDRRATVARAGSHRPSLRLWRKQISRRSCDSRSTGTASHCANLMGLRCEGNEFSEYNYSLIS